MAYGRKSGSKKAKPTAVSLFSGAGGLDLGVAQAGFENICRIERDANCVETLKQNNKRARIIQEDLHNINPRRLMGELGIKKGDLDLIHGGPPCQPFSQMGLHTGILHSDGDGLSEFIRFVRAMRPKAILCEQVEGLLKHREVFDDFLKTLKRLGYATSYSVINSLDVGVPQARKRLFITGIRGDSKGLELVPKKRKAKSVQDALLGLPSPDRNGVEEIENHIDCTPNRDKERISYVREGSWLSKSDAPESIRGKLTRKDTTKYRRLARDSHSLTLRCGEIFYHFSEDRYITPRECMRLHGYPDNYVLAGPVRRRTGIVSNLDQHRQVANSVPPPLAKQIATVIRDKICT